MGLSSAMFFALIFNGFVGFQIWRDGGMANMLTLVGGSLIFMTLSLLLGINRVIEFVPNFGMDNYSIMVAFLGFPAICILTYAICQSVLIVRTLGLFNPLLYVGFSALCVSLYSVIAFALNDEVIKGCFGYVDGLAFGNFFLVIASVLIYAYWNSITQSDADKKY